MAIVMASTPDEATADHQIYDKVQMAKDDATKILSKGSSSSFMEVSIIFGRSFGNSSVSWNGIVYREDLAFTKKLFS